MLHYERLEILCSKLGEPVGFFNAASLFFKNQHYFLNFEICQVFWSL